MELFTKRYFCIHFYAKLLLRQPQIGLPITSFSVVKHTIITIDARKNYDEIFETQPNSYFRDKKSID
jgi:hypothetical protein